MAKYKELKIIVDLLKPKRYLEIGIDYGLNIIAVDCPYKAGIDPDPKTGPEFPCKVYHSTSDIVFNSNEFKSTEQSFDLIFIDGLHEFNQVVRDIEHSLSILNHSGIIICHDVYPFDHLKEEHILDNEFPGKGISWTGDVWKTIFYVRYKMPNLQFCVLNSFPGYLYIYHASKPRVDEVKLISTKDIKNLSIDYGISHIDEMHICTEKELIEKCQIA